MRIVTVKGKTEFHATKKEIHDLHRILRLFKRNLDERDILRKGGLCVELYYYGSPVLRSIFTHIFEPDNYNNSFWVCDGNTQFLMRMYYEYTSRRKALLELFIESFPDLFTIIPD